MRRLLLLACLFCACAPVRPARFADAPAVEEVADDAPIPVPQVFDPVREVWLSEAYVRRPLIDTLDPSRVPDALDVNALDEVPRSRWLSSEDAPAAADDEEAPAYPFRPLEVKHPGTHEDALAVVDARGRRFELFRDPEDRPEMSTGAAAAASRLLRALGYYTPGVWVLDIGWSDFVLRDLEGYEAVRDFFHKGPRSTGGHAFRASATRWPIGIDLGPTRAIDRRADDPNDRVAHTDRRTLRALKVVFGWLGITRIDREVLRDAYVGAPDHGHVVHYIAGLHGAFGADAVVRPEAPRDDDADLGGRNIWKQMGSLGLYTPDVKPTQKRFPAIGEYEARFSCEEFGTSPPFDPMDRLLPADAYWAAKRIAALSTETLRSALDAAWISDDAARAKLAEILDARRLAVIKAGFAMVTPVDVEGIAPEHPPRLLLRDEAALRGFTEPAGARYRVELCDETGKVLASSEITPGGPRFAVPLPESAPRYVVLRVRGKKAPRAMQIHLVKKDGGRKSNPWAVVGVRH